MSDQRPRVVGVRFQNAGKIHYYDSAGLRLETGEYVVVSTTRGPELARVVIAPDQVLVDEIDHDDLPPILRPAGSGDIERARHLSTRAADILGEARALAAESGFQGAIQKLEFTLDARRLTIHYDSPDRVDHREFARKAARQFDVRIDMHNLGPRDRARLAGGYGICGRELCCANWLQAFPSISIRMAKEQDKPLNPEKISGLCGRLLCCLSYEEEGYREMRRSLPKVGHRVSTPTGEGRVAAVNVLKRSITILVDGQRLDISDRDLGTVVRWDPSSKSNEPPPSITRAEAVRQGLVEPDDLDDVPDANEWPPRATRFGRLPLSPVLPPPPPERRERPERPERPAARREEPSETAPGTRSSRRRRGGDGAPRQERQQPDRTPRREGPPAPRTPPAGRSRVFRRSGQSEGDEPAPPRPGRAEPEGPAAGPQQGGGGRRRGRRAGRRRGRGGGADNASET
jgi:cell fate regulator YaaT (PSP1 superfamily)